MTVDFTKKRGAARAWVLVALAITATACLSERTPLGGQCELNSECDSPYVCRLTRCRRECAGNRDCPVGLLCVRDSQGLGACLLPEETTCARPSDCPAPLLCLGGGCTEECASERDCTVGSTCEGEPGMRYCADGADERCRRDSDCAEGLGCGLDRRCRADCQRDRDCREGARCESGSCVPIEALDGGLPDAGEPDTGPDDAGPDAGAEDGGSDAGPDGGSDAGPGVPCTSPSDCTAPDVVSARCVARRCVVETCATGLGDCDADFATGCETPTDTVLNCGGCGDFCGVGGQCTTGACDAVVDVGVTPENYVCFARSGGRVLCSGSTLDGELGRGVAATAAGVPQAMMTSTPYTRVEVGPAVTCVWDPGGAGVACTGANVWGQIGDGTNTNRTVPSSVVPAVNGEVSIGGYQEGPTADDAFACVLDASASGLSCWGGELIRMDAGSGNLNSATPQTDAALPGPATAVDLGWRSACGVFSGQVFCWGEAAPWAGTTETTGRVTPTRVGAFDDAVDVSVAEKHACAVRSGGTVECWGDNLLHRAGGGIPLDGSSSAPVPVAGVIDAVSIETGRFHSCALRSTGDVVCWGSAAIGNPAVALGASTPTPLSPLGLSDVVVLSSAGPRNCALRRDGAVLCWGSDHNQGGDFGDPTDSTIWTVPTLHPFFPPTPVAP